MAATGGDNSFRVLVKKVPIFFIKSQIKQKN